MTLNKRGRRAIGMGYYEFIHQEYRKEGRKRKPDQTRIKWLKELLLDMQEIMKTTWPADIPLEFEEL